MTSTTDSSTTETDATTKVAFLVAPEGIEQIELTGPWEAVEQAGATPVLLSTEDGTVQAFNHLDKGDTFDVDVTVASADVADYAALVLPGGVANPDALRTDQDAVAFVRQFVQSGKPVAAICHAPWTLIEADVVRDRTSRRGRACRPTCATPARPGRTGRSSSTTTSSPAATPTTSPRSPAS